MAQNDKDDFILPSRGALQRLKDDQKVDKEIDQQLSGLSTSSEYRARLAETSRAQLPGKSASSWTVLLPSIASMPASRVEALFTHTMGIHERL